MDDKERVVDVSDPFVKTASTTTVNNNEGAGAGASQRFPNARRHQGFCWSSLEKQASLKEGERLSPRALLHPVQVLGRTGQRLTGGSSQMRPTQHR